MQEGRHRSEDVPSLEHRGPQDAHQHRMRLGTRIGEIPRRERS